MNSTELSRNRFSKQLLSAVFRNGWQLFPFPCYCLKIKITCSTLIYTVLNASAILFLGMETFAFSLGFVCFCLIFPFVVYDSYKYWSGKLYSSDCNMTEKRCLADFTCELNTNIAAKKIQHSRRTHSKMYFVRNMGYKSSGFSDSFICSSWAWYKNMPHKAEFKTVQELLLFCYPAVWCWRELPAAEALWVPPAHRGSSVHTCTALFYHLRCLFSSGFSPHSSQNTQNVFWRSSQLSLGRELEHSAVEIGISKYTGKTKK